MASWNFHHCFDAFRGFTFCSPALRRAATGPVGRAAGAMKAAELVRAMAATRPLRAVLRIGVAAPSMLLVRLVP